ncbi:MAG: hypothetical protein ACLP0L_20060 [Solirubrobacteraceae bacterium]
MIAHTPRAKNLALLLLAMTQFVIVIDASIVNVALPSIGAHLHFSRDDLTWAHRVLTGRSSGPRELRPLQTHPENQSQAKDQNS